MRHTSNENFSIYRITGLRPHVTQKSCYQSSNFLLRASFLSICSVDFYSFMLPWILNMCFLHPVLYIYISITLLYILVFFYFISLCSYIAKTITNVIIPNSLFITFSSQLHVIWWMFYFIFWSSNMSNFTRHVNQTIQDRIRDRNRISKDRSDTVTFSYLSFENREHTIMLNF